jgi:hypothetical protein
MPLYAACIIVAAYTAAIFIKEIPLRLIFLYTADAAAVGLMVLISADTRLIIFFSAVSFALNIYFCVPPDKPKKSVFSRNDLLLIVPGAAVAAFAAVFAGKFGIIKTQAVSEMLYPAAASFTIFIIFFTAGYFLMTAGKETENDE